MSIEEQAFDNCKALTSITCKATVPPVIASENCFSATTYENATLQVPSASLSAYRDAYGWQMFYNAYGNTPGDVNGDGAFSISDIGSLIDLLLADSPASVTADVNGDGQLTIADVVVLIDILLGVE